MRSRLSVLSCPKFLHLSIRVGHGFRVGEGVRVGDKDDPVSRIPVCHLLSSHPLQHPPIKGLPLEVHSDFIDARLGEFLQVCHQFIRAGSHDGAQHVGIEGETTRLLDNLSPLDCSDVVGYRQGSPHFNLVCFSVFYWWESAMVVSLPTIVRGL